MPAALQRQTFPATLVNGAGSLEGVTPTLAYYIGTAATGTPLSARRTVGTYIVLASFAGSSDYAAASNTATFNITPRPLVITANPQNVTQGYTSLPALTYTLTTGSLAGTDILSGSLSCNAAALGTYDITQGSLSAGSNYALTFYPSLLYVTLSTATVGSDQTAGSAAAAARSVPKSPQPAPGRPRRRCSQQLKVSTALLTWHSTRGTPLLVCPLRAPTSTSTSKAAT